MFSVGDKVCLKIDSSKIGIVTDVTPVGNTTYQYEVFHNLSIHLTQLLVTSDLKRQIGAFTAASARRSKRVS